MKPEKDIISIDYSKSGVKSSYWMGGIFAAIAIAALIGAFICFVFLSDSMIYGLYCIISSLVLFGISYLLLAISTVADMAVKKMAIMESKYKFEEGKGGSQSNQFLTGDLVTGCIPVR
ncbi:MAG: hypothetical protein LBH06_06410 [Rikenellaceae bacterium]|jgi:hypothetical protein|nr:hypothetical protein [Rikenellaceae bacterium]